MTAPLLPSPGEPLTQQTIDDLIADMSAWRSGVSTELLDIDEQVRLSGPSSSAGDVGLAFLLWRALAARLDEIIAARGTSGLNRDAAARVSALVWSPVVDPGDGALAAHLPEARTIFDALLVRLRNAVGQNSARISANASLLGPITDRVNAAKLLASRLGNMTNQVEAIAARLGPLGPSLDPAAVASAVAAIDAELRPIEVDLASLSRSQSALDDDIQAVHQRVTAAFALERNVRGTARRCAEKIADPPRLGIPSVAVLGPVPAAAADVDWRTTRTDLDTFSARLGRVERALAMAGQAYSAPLDRRADLRGLLESYRAMAGASGLGERVDASTAYDTAHESLWSAPCKLEAAAQLVAAYQRIVTATAHAAASHADGERPSTDQSPAMSEEAR